MENVLPDNTKELYAIFNRLLEELKKTPYNVKLCIDTHDEDLKVELIHYNKGYEYNNKTVNFYSFQSLEELPKLENDATEIMRNNKLFIREFYHEYLWSNR